MKSKEVIKELGISRQQLKRLVDLGVIHTRNLKDSGKAVLDYNEKSVARYKRIRRKTTKRGVTVFLPEDNVNRSLVGYAYGAEGDIRRQVDAISSYAKKNSLKLGKIYTEKEVNGPEFDSMLDEVANRNIAGILISSVSRIRRFCRLSTLNKLMLASGCSVVLVGGLKLTVNEVVDDFLYILEDYDIADQGKADIKKMLVQMLEEL